MDHDEVLRIVHQTAAEIAAGKGDGAAVLDEAVGEDDLMHRYGFTSIDALEYLLILEEKFDVTMEDEDLNEEVLSSASGLAHHITGLLG
jgi:acyl carrier protein